MAEPADRGTPEWWRKRLLEELAKRATDVQTLERYYAGDHPLPRPPDKMQHYREAANAFGTLSKMGATNYVKLVADAPAERLRVTGFRFGEIENLDADPVAWRIWQRNHLDADSGTGQHKAIVTGQSFVLVWPTDGLAEVTIEHPAQAIVAYAPGSYRRRAAGLKCWVDDENMRRVVLYLPDKVYKWSLAVPDGNEPIVEDSAEYARWQPTTDETWPIVNPLGVVPLIEFRANPDLIPSPFGGGQGEFATVLSIQDRINKTIFDRLVTAEFQAFRQRWAVGWTPDDPNHGIQASMSHLMSFENENVTVGEFAQADFRGFIDAVESDVQAMAAITRTPSFYTLGSISNISGDALTALQSGLIAKTEAHRDNFGESWEEVLRLALQAEGDARASDESSTVLWRDIEHRTWAERADAILKLSAVGVPREALWAMLPNVTPQDIERWRVMAAEEALFAPETEQVTGGAA